MKKLFKSIVMKAFAGIPFNLSSSKQVREVLYDVLKLDEVSGATITKTAGGVKSTCEATLKKLEKFHQVPGMILKHRQLSKSQSAYIKGLLQHNKGGRLHTTWDQTGAATGRLTSVSPNLQAIPKTELQLARSTVHLRSAFVASPGFVLVAADYEQIELRILAHLSGDRGLLKAIRSGGDVFTELAALWLGKSADRVVPPEREKTKHMVYALMYGAGRNRLSEILEVTQDQAQEFINSFYNKFCQLKSFNKSVVARATEKGCLVTMFGRRRRFPHINSANVGLKIQSQRQAFNFLIQGSAADIAKNSVILTEKKLRLRKLKARALLLIHDEIVWEVQVEDQKECIEQIGLCLQDHEAIFPSRIDFKVPLRVKLSVGSNLASMTTLERVN